jgi:hypothetical protein
MDVQRKMTIYLILKTTVDGQATTARRLAVVGAGLVPLASACTTDECGSQLLGLSGSLNDE